MDYSFSTEQDEFRGLLQTFAREKVAPYAEEWDEKGQFPLDTVLELGKLGAFGITFPEEYGGLGLEFATLCIAIEELARADSSMAITLSAGVGLGANPIYSFGTEEQKRRYLPDMCEGKALGAFGLTEPDAGSDAGATRTSASFDEVAGEWVINGSKAYITNSGTPITSVITVTARTDQGISAFLVPAGTPGLVVEPAYRKLGWHASDTHGLYLDEVRVPAENLLGAPGRGFAQFLAILDDGRVAISALAVGLAQGCLDASLEYAKTRNAFGGPIGKHQAVAFMCSDMATKIEAARALTYRAAWLKDSGRPFGQAAAMAKLFSTESAMDAARIATQIFGGAGFIEGNAVARHYRDAKILEIGEGTSEIQRLVIARSLGLPVS
ncbi:MAG: acyl-CoA dehydrogenase family protein [Actinomycetota bacterium]|nr:acyl-CoA dehydrogenase family protein [Actinomycetota bacterium]MDA8397789.1 acyl-CoA dehydrogenase family protein [Actinomycetota bacterium]